MENKTVRNANLFDNVVINMSKENKLMKSLTISSSPLNMVDRPKLEASKEDPRRKFYRILACAPSGRVKNLFVFNDERLFLTVQYENQLLNADELELPDDYIEHIKKSMNANTEQLNAWKNATLIRAYLEFDEKVAIRPKDDEGRIRTVKRYGLSNDGISCSETEVIKHSYSNWLGSWQLNEADLQCLRKHQQPSKDTIDWLVGSILKSIAETCDIRIS